uniref:HMG box domain-containing protein n=1 Tax=Globodera rostochiensis TaxID=31243 RepID=A0A914GYY3_GLORO
MSHSTSEYNELDEPKPAQTSFFLWMNENREKFHEPGMTQADVAKAAGAEWRRMPESEKAKWGQKSAEDKERFAQELSEQRERQHEAE